MNNILRKFISGIIFLSQNLVYMLQASEYDLGEFLLGIGEQKISEMCLKEKFS